MTDEDTTAQDLYGCTACGARLHLGELKIVWRGWWIGYAGYCPKCGSYICELQLKEVEAQ